LHFKGDIALIFSIGDHIKQIIEGTKTQTRRMSKSYLVGRTYSIQPGRGKSKIHDGQILILKKIIETNPYDKISESDALAEGGYTTEQFESLFNRMYPDWDERCAYTFKFVPKCTQEAKQE